MLRSCYTRQCVFGTDPAVMYRIKWFFASHGAKDLGFPTPFVSRNYLSAGEWPDVGEVEDAARVWRNGSFPIFVSGLHGPCGPRPIWDEGADVPNPPGLNRDDFGLAWCCNPQVDPDGQPVFGFWPEAPTKQNILHQIKGTLSTPRGVGHQVSATLAEGREVDHDFVGVIAATAPIYHDVAGVIAVGREVEHEVSAEIAEERTADHDVTGFIDGRGPIYHQVQGWILPSPGWVILGTGGGFWSPPQGIFAVNAFLWSSGGPGYDNPSPAPSSGGGGGGFVGKFNLAVNSFSIYGYLVSAPGSADVCFFTYNTGQIFCTPGEPGNVVDGGLGGQGSLGDINQTGGTGGSIYHIGSPTMYGGGGGGSAGMGGDGADGGNADVALPGLGGDGDGLWGNGGNGANPLNSLDGLPGNFPGGAGGGSGYISPSGGDVGAGAEGQLLITWFSAVHWIRGVISSEETESHEVQGAIAELRAATHDVQGALANLRSATHDFKGLLASVRSVTHDFKALLAQARSASHTVQASVKGPRTVIHTVQGQLGQGRSATHTVQGFTASANNAVQFTGISTSKMTASDASLPAGASARSISMWAKFATASPGGVHDLLIWGQFATNNANWFTCNGNQFFNACTASCGGNVGDPAVTITNKFHMVWIYSSGGNWTLYLNNVPHAQVLGSATPNTNTFGLVLGAPYNVVVQDFRVYNIALSGAQVSAIWNGGVQSLSAGLMTNLSGWWKMNEGSGTTAADSANGRTGTLANANWVSM